MIIIISGSTFKDGGASSKFYMCIFQIAMACGYIVLVTWIMAPLLSKIQNQSNALETQSIDNYSEV
ncbi:hypothetical protein [Pseudoalteromonas sp. G4]|uniref:hypothetical protein n=1 Tax=Pseudoalteromonas sp. G4 TaxID=2992761 RepID=UPI00237E80EA|nr:hypothetical protein [Pseudoalteromonas sp. G4]MDE3272085.1 hypothetical protein [Pseudoalteromonas sp. G4]